MTALAAPPPPKTRSASEPEPTWEIAYLYPPQGSWTVEEYLALDTNRLIELVDGRLEFLELPSYEHQDWVDFLHTRLKQFVGPRGLGRAYFSPLPTWTVESNYREPDVLFVTPEQRAGRRHATAGASLVMEVVSDDEKSKLRDREEKRTEYAAAGIPEYWIVDPEPRTVTVLTLPAGGGEYAEHGVFAEGETASSVLLDGFAVDVSELFAAADV